MKQGGFFEKCCAGAGVRWRISMTKLAATFLLLAVSVHVVAAGSDSRVGGVEPAQGMAARNAMGGSLLPVVRSSSSLLVSPGAVYGATESFIETYDDGTDVGLWHCSVNAMRAIEPSGGNPGAYLQQGGFSTAVPIWASVSTRYQPGVNDPYKVDSIYTGDWTTLGVTTLTVDLNVIQVATWATDRATTLELLQMDETGFNVTYDATYTLPDLPDPPVGWQTYSFPINANSPIIPDGWVCTHGDGSPCTDPEWSQFLHRVDLTSVGFYKPGFVYPNLGTWVLGIDNVELDCQAGPTPTPSPTVTPSPTATPRARPTPRTRPSPHARPTP